MSHFGLNVKQHDGKTTQENKKKNKTNKQRDTLTQRRKWKRKKIAYT